MPVNPGDCVIAIVGAGPWGTYALDRLAARVNQLTTVGIRLIVVFDAAGSFGDGRIHSADQVSTSRLNRVASQVGFAADESLIGAPLLPRELRPTLAEWSTEGPTADAKSVRAMQAPTRSLHGYALRAAFRRHESHLQASGVDVECIHGTVTSVRPDQRGVSLLFLDSGRACHRRVRAVLLTTGHGVGRANETGVLLSGPYPLRAGVRESNVPAGGVVAVDGAGLTAIDVLIHLTEGRGGAFVDGPKGLRYVPSGREPSRILPVSPGGLLPSARPRNQKATDASGLGHQALELDPRWFSLATVECIEQRRRSLDFDRDILPFVVAEMALTYYCVLVGETYVERLAQAGHGYVAKALADGEPLRFDDLVGQLHQTFMNLWAYDAVRSRVRSIVCALPSSPWLIEAVSWPDSLRFDWHTFADPLGNLTSGLPWSEAVLCLMRWDLACAEQGNLDNPWKAAWDGVWRDLRPVLSRVLDFDALSSDSKERFLQTHWRTYARQVNGADPDTVAKVIALIEAGLVDLSAGRGAQIAAEGERHVITTTTSGDIAVDVVVPGRVPKVDLRSEPPFAQMLREGQLRDRTHVVGESVPDLSRGFHPLSISGSEDRRITIVGVPTEGVVFFQLALARPHSSGSVIGVLEGWAAELVGEVLRPRTESVSQTLR